MPSDRSYRRTPLWRSWPTFFAAYLCSEETLLRLCTRCKLYAITDYFCAADRMFSRPFAHISLFASRFRCLHVLTSFPNHPGSDKPFLFAMASKIVDTR